MPFHVVCHDCVFEEVRDEEYRAKFLARYHEEIESDGHSVEYEEIEDA